MHGHESEKANINKSFHSLGKIFESGKFSFGDFSGGTLSLRAISMPHFSHTNFYFLSVIFVPKKKTPA